MKRLALNSITLSWFLMALIGLLIIGAIVGCLQLQSMLSARVAAADHAQIDADIGNSQLDKAKALQTYLATHKDDVDKAAQVVAESQTYQYQNQIVQDINKYASKAHVSILGYTFPSTVIASNKATAGLKAVAATVTLKNPVAYTDYLHFLKLIEQNLTKMQITDIALSPDDKKPSLVNNPSIGLQVYVK